VGYAYSHSVYCSVDMVYDFRYFLCVAVAITEQLSRPSSAVAAAVRPRDASCLSVASTVQYTNKHGWMDEYLECRLCSILVLVISASDLPMRTIKFCSVVLGVTSKLSIINKID